MLTLEDAVPCSICRAKPVLSGGWRTGRLKCPNYKSKEILHGNLNCNRNGLAMGFTNWCDYFWNDEQIKNEGIPIIVEEWNYIQKNHVTNSEFGKMIYLNRKSYSVDQSKLKNCFQVKKRISYDLFRLWK